MITKADAAAAAKQGKKESIKVSIKHHEDPGNMTSLELQVAIKEKRFNVGAGACALCQKFNECVCTNCPLNTDETSCCIEYRLVDTTCYAFKKNPSNANHTAFLAAEAKMVERLKVELTKVVAEETKKWCKDCKHNNADSPCRKCIDHVNFEPKEKQVELRLGDYGAMGTGNDLRFVIIEINNNQVIFLWYDKLANRPWTTIWDKDSVLNSQELTFDGHLNHFDDLQKNKNCIGKNSQEQEL
ncbi:hypothetical protein LCGC14_1205760 [marine sediment metagenome]|uniref:Uncharacterized protein n=1 Tax=marine sediment metagenome TaxID=412755 RepID=A0A0F9NXR8_9ZZZZ